MLLAALPCHLSVTRGGILKNDSFPAGCELICDKPPFTLTPWVLTDRINYPCLPFRTIFVTHIWSYVGISNGILVLCGLNCTGSNPDYQKM